MDSDAPWSIRDHPKPVRVAIILFAVAVVLSLLYGIQYFSGSPLRFPASESILDVAVSPDQHWVAAAIGDGTVRLWDVEGEWSSDDLPRHGGAAVGVVFSPDSSTLISAGEDGTIRAWDPAGREAIAVLDAEGALSGFSLAADGSTLAAIREDGLVQVWELATRSLIQSFIPPDNPGRAVAVNADGTQLATGAGNNVQLWDARSGEPLRFLEGRWRNPVSQQDWLGHDEEVTALAFSSDGLMLASGSADTTIVFWNLTEGQAEWGASGHWAAVTDLVFDADGQVLLSAGADSKVRTWWVEGGSNTGIFEGHLGTVNAVAFGPGPDRILSASRDGTMRLWNDDTRRQLRVEWTRYGFQPVWGETFAVWALASGLVGLLALWGLVRVRPWGYLLSLGILLMGPTVVLGLPLLETLSYPASWLRRLQIASPLLVLTLGYGLLAIYFTRTRVCGIYQAPPSRPLAEQLMINRRMVRVRFGLYATTIWLLVLVVLYSVLRRFNLDVAFMGHFFSFVMAGAGTTLYVSAASIVLAIVLALLGALGRLSGNPIANGVSGFYVSLIRGTPLLVQIYIWYLGLPRLEIVLPAEIAGILALAVNYGAYMTEIFRAGIQAIGKGQVEAAHALGMSGAQAFRRIVLPQAFRIVIPPIGNEFIAMMKDSSLVMVMGVWELTFRAQKVGRQYFRSMETLIIAAAFYWALTVAFQFLQGKLEEHMARGERK